MNLWNVSVWTTNGECGWSSASHGSSLSLPPTERSKDLVTTSCFCETTLQFNIHWANAKDTTLYYIHDASASAVAMKDHLPSILHWVTSKKNLLHMRGEDIWLLACFLSSPKFGHQNLYLSQFIVTCPCSLGGTHDPLNKMTKVCWYISFNISLKTPMFERVAFTTFTYALLDLHAWVSLEAFCRVRFSNLVVIPKCCATMAC